MHAAHVRLLQPLDEMVLAVLVHQEADGSPVHAVNGNAVVDEAVQGLQHETVAAERNDGVRLPGGVEP